MFSIWLEKFNETQSRVRSENFKDPYAPKTIANKEDNSMIRPFINPRKNPKTKTQTIKISK